MSAQWGHSRHLSFQLCARRRTCKPTSLMGGGLATNPAGSHGRAPAPQSLSSGMVRPSCSPPLLLQPASCLRSWCSICCALPRLRCALPASRPGWAWQPHGRDGRRGGEQWRGSGGHGVVGEPCCPAEHAPAHQFGPCVAGVSLCARLHPCCKGLGLLMPVWLAPVHCCPAPRQVSLYICNAYTVDEKNPAEGGFSMDSMLDCYALCGQTVRAGDSRMHAAGCPGESNEQAAH